MSGTERSGSPTVITTPQSPCLIQDGAERGRIVSEPAQEHAIDIRGDTRQQARTGASSIDHPRLIQQPVIGQTEQRFHINIMDSPTNTQDGFSKTS
jgi:hypothetical protein